MGRPQVTVWLAGAVHVPEAHAHAHLLDKTEHTQWQRLQRTRHGAEPYLVARVLRRMALQAHTGADAQAWSFEVDHRGQPTPRLGAASPSPRHAAAKLALSLSHTGPFVAVAVAEAGALGVDIELLGRYDDRPELADRLARRYLTAGEWARVRAQSPRRQAAAFVQQWVCKEAALKALGQGLRGAWTQVAPAVPLGPMGPGEVRWGPTAIAQGISTSWACALVTPDPWPQLALAVAMNAHPGEPTLTLRVGLPALAGP